MKTRLLFPTNENKKCQLENFIISNFIFFFSFVYAFQFNQCAVAAYSVCRYACVGSYFFAPFFILFFFTQRVYFCRTVYAYRFRFVEFTRSLLVNFLMASGPTAVTVEESISFFPLLFLCYFEKKLNWMSRRQWACVKTLFVFFFKCVPLFVCCFVIKYRLFHVQIFLIHMIYLPIRSTQMKTYKTETKQSHTVRVVTRLTHRSADRQT